MGRFFSSLVRTLRASVFIAAWIAPGPTSPWASAYAGGGDAAPPSFLRPVPTPIGPQKAATLHGMPKYQGAFHGFDYVNSNAPQGGQLTYGVQGSFDSFNPFVIKGQPAAGLTPIHASVLHATLLESSRDEPFSKYPYAAESIHIAPDRSWVIFTLRPGITFHDGSPIRPSDVVFSFDILRTKGSPFYRGYYGGVVDVEVLDDRRVRFRLKTNTSPETPLILGEFPILSKAYYQGDRFEKADLTPPLGSGPYRIGSFRAGQEVTYEKIKNWWGAGLPIHVGRYNTDRVRYLYFRDDDVMFEAFKAGAYDVRFETSIKNWTFGYDFPDARHGQIVRESMANQNPHGSTDLFMNTRRPHLKDPRVRRALINAFDFEWMNAHLFYGLYHRLVTYFPPNGLSAPQKVGKIDGYYLGKYRTQINNAVWGPLPAVPIMDGSAHVRRALLDADQLLTAAGWVVQNGIRRHHQTGAPLRLEVIIQTPALVRVLDNYRRMLKRLGIFLSIRLLDTAQYAARLDQYDYDMVMTMQPQSPSPGNEQLGYFGSTSAKTPGTQNYAGIADPVVDRLIQDVIQAPNRTALQGACQALDRLLLWGFYKVPGYGSTHLRLAYRRHVGKVKGMPAYGLDPSTFWVHPKGN